MHEPDLWNHLLGHDIQPLRLAFRWIMRGFSGHLPPDQLLFLWDLVLAYDSMEVCLSCGNFPDRFNTNYFFLYSSDISAFGSHHPELQEGELDAGGQPAG